MKVRNPKILGKSLLFYSEVLGWIKTSVGGRPLVPVSQKILKAYNFTFIVRGTIS